MVDASKAESQQEEQQQEEGVAIEIELPKVDTAIGDNVFFVKLPNFLSIETKPFDQAFYEDEIDEDEVMDDEGRARLKLKVCFFIFYGWSIVSLLVSVLNFLFCFII